MKTVARMAAGALGALMLSATTASAQRGSPITISRGSFEVIPYTGYLVSEKLVSGPLGTDIGAANGALFGAQVGMPLNPYASLLGGIAYSSGDLQAGVPILGGIGIGSSKTLLYDAVVQVRLAGNDGEKLGAIPFFQLGAGAAHRELSAVGLNVSSTDFVASGGLGIDYAVSRQFAIRLMAKDYFGTADFGVGPVGAKAEDLHALALTTGVRLSF